jgi:thiol-disulfide isomerase/thioredoxin
MKRLKAFWIALRKRQWLSLGFDVLVIVIVFLLIHAWNTRELPRGGRVPDLPLALLDSTRLTEVLPQGNTGVVYFFAPWCFYCRNSIDNLDALVSKGDIAWARAVALDYEDPSEVREFVAKTGLSQPVLLGNGQTARDWNIRAFPTYFVVDAEGRISSRSVGYSTWLGLWARTKTAR